MYPPKTGVGKVHTTALNPIALRRETCTYFTAICKDCTLSVFQSYQCLSHSTQYVCACSAFSSGLTSAYSTSDVHEIILIIISRVWGTSIRYRKCFNTAYRDGTVCHLPQSCAHS